jgi:hypothetical protein
VASEIEDEKHFSMVVQLIRRSGLPFARPAGRAPDLGIQPLVRCGISSV